MIHPWNLGLQARLLADPARMPHALLLHGPAGVGKLALARGIAQALLCERPTPQRLACGGCDACNWFEQGNHPDYRQLEPPDADTDPPEADAGDAAAPTRTATPQAVIRIGHIRALTDFSQLSAHRAGWRIAVIAPAERMKHEAANALLKTLEEPAPGVLLMLVSHRLGRLLPTLVSRCRQMHVGLPEPAAALAWLTAQGIPAAREALAEAGGAPLAALELSDAERVSQREHFLDQLARFEQLDACALALEFKGEHARVWGWLLRWLLDALSQRLAGRCRYFIARAEQTAALAARADLAALLSLQRALLHAGRSLQHPLHSQLLIESWLVRYVRLAGGRTA